MAEKNVTVFFATNRMPIMDASDKKIIDFSSELGPIDGTAVRFGSVDVRVTSKEATLLPETLFVADEKLVGPNQQLGSRTIFDQLKKDMATGGRPTLVIVHGYSNDFSDAMERAATILNFYGLDANVFSFTWPSRGSALPIPLPYVDYFHDRFTARASGVAIGRTLRILYDYIDGLKREERCYQPLHLICHSMGCYALRHGIQALMRLPLGEPREHLAEIDAPNVARDNLPFPALVAIPSESSDENRLRRTFDQIVLAAADDDEDAFSDPRELKFLPRLGTRVTVYHTRLDWVLSTLSHFTKFNGPRLGNDGPENMSSISDKIFAVDVSDIVNPSQDDADIQNHQYYRVFPAVRDDIVSVLKGERQDLIPHREQISPYRYQLRRRAAARRRRVG